MKRLIAAAVLALGMAMLCSMRVYAAGGQRIVTLPEGGPYRLDAAAIERETGPFEALAVTLAPEGDRAVLFSARSAAVGFTALSSEADAPGEAPRIRCINPDFSGQTDNGASPLIKEVDWFDQ